MQVERSLTKVLVQTCVRWEDRSQWRCRASGIAAQDPAQLLKLQFTFVFGQR